MAKIIVEFLDKTKRAYELPESFTFRENREMKRMTGLRMGEWWESLDAGDTDVIVAFATIAARRAGHDLEETILDLPMSAITIEGDEDPTVADAEIAPAEPTMTIPADGGTPDSSGSTA